MLHRLCSHPLLRPSSLKRTALTGLLLLALSVSSVAHPESEVAIDELTQWIARHPRQPSLYFSRSQHFIDHERWTEAEKDLLQVEALAAEHPGLNLAFGRLYLAMGRWVDARRRTDRARSADPLDPTVLIISGRIHAQLGQTAAAAEDFSRAIELLPEPRPELYLERAALSLSAADTLQGLKEGIERIGPALPLVERAITLECSLGQTDAALARLDTLIQSSSRQEFGWKRRGDVLQSVGRTAEARSDYLRAHAALSLQPTWLQQTADAQVLALELKRLLTDSDTSAPRPATP